MIPGLISSPIESGVPQGSVLGPLLFLIYINDLEANMKSKINIFCNDTMICSLIHDPVISAYDLNHDLEKINKWAYQWKMAFNPEPNKQAVEVLFSKKINNPDHPPLYFNGYTVSKVKVHKHLGLNLDSNCHLSVILMKKSIKQKSLSAFSSTFPEDSWPNVQNIHSSPF